MNIYEDCPKCNLRFFSIYESGYKECLYCGYRESSRSTTLDVYDK
jgi:hypothetical protein